jgi:hypothetical protein
MKTVFLVPYLREGFMNIFAAPAFSRNPRAIKSAGIESMEPGLSKKSNESFQLLRSSENGPFEVGEIGF